jgi:hypothetical protein
MFSSVKKIIQDAKKGKIFILIDYKNRQNEGEQRLNKCCSCIRRQCISWIVGHDGFAHHPSQQRSSVIAVLDRLWAIHSES